MLPIRTTYQPTLNDGRSPASAVAEEGHAGNQAHQISLLKAQIRQAERDRDILKKTLLIFLKDKNRLL